MPSCISASSLYLAVGTSLSNVALFEVGVKNFRLLEPIQKEGFGFTTAVALSKDNKFMVCGF